MGRRLLPSGRALPARRPPLARLAVAAVVAIVVGLIAGYVVANRTGGSPRARPWRNLSPGIGSLGVFNRPLGHVFRQRRYYVGYVRTHGGRVVPAGFPQHMVVFFAAGPRSTPAYRLGVTKVTEQHNAMVVSIVERTPGVGDRTPPRLSFPFLAISIPWSRKPVIIDWVGRP